MYKLTCSVMHVIAAFLQLLQKTLNCQLSWTDSLCPSWISWRRQIFVSILLDCAYGKLPDPSHQYFFISLFLSIPCLGLLKPHMNVSSVPVGCNSATTRAAKSDFNKLVLNATTCKTTLIWLSPVTSKTLHKEKESKRIIPSFEKDCLQQNERRLQ